MELFNHIIAFMLLNRFIFIIGLLTSAWFLYGYKPLAKKDTLNTTANFKGVNWADQRDNYTTGKVVLSGLDSTDNYVTVKKISKPILTAFTNAGANMVRLPINPQTVKSTWWKAYRAAIDVALSKNIKVILCCWEGNVKKDGRIDDMNAFWEMWQSVIKSYNNNRLVYFEIFNEPFGYSETEWKAVCTEWLSRYEMVNKSHILVGGTGYCAQVTPMGADNRFDGCLLSLHVYSWWGGKFTNESGWQGFLKKNYGSYSNRTIVTEFGAPMSKGLDYNNLLSNNLSIAFITGITNCLYAEQMGSCYWPGLRDKDSYSLFKRVGDSLIINSTAGLKRVQHGWKAN